MKSALCFTLCCLAACFFLASCDEDNDPLGIQHAPTGNDGFNDVTFFDNSLFTTNRELGREIHNPVYLYRLNPATGETLDRYFLEMTDQGFLSLTNDGEHLYLLGGGHSIIILNAVGEWIGARTTYPDFMDWILSAGVYNADVDSLFFVTQRKVAAETHLRIYNFDTPTRGMALVRQATLPQRCFLTSLEYAVGDQEYYGIAFDQDGSPIILRLDGDFAFMSSAAALDPLVTGISRTATGWVLLTKDRRVMSWAP